LRPSLELEPLAITDSGRCPHALFGAGDHRDFVERSPTDTECEPGVPDQRQPQYAEAVDRSAALRTVAEEIEGEPTVDMLLGNDIVEAARSDQTDDIPVAHELDPCPRHEEHTDGGSAGSEQPRRTVDHLERTSADPVRMATATAEACSARVMV